MDSPAHDFRSIARKAISAPATRWRMLPLTSQLMLLGVGLVVAWMLVTRAYDHVTRPQRDVEARAQHWQQAELIAERVAAAAYELQGAARGYAITGDTVRRRDASEARMRHAALLDTLERLATVDHDILTHVRAYDDMASRWRSSLDAAWGARDSRQDVRPYVARERPLFDSTRVMGTALLDEMRGREHVARMETRALIASRESFLLRMGPIVTTLLLLAMAGLLLRRTLLAVSQSARALAEGRYTDVRLPAELGGNREMRQIADTFEGLALAIEEREQILQSDILQMREYEQLKSDFVSTVSHELRTPLHLDAWCTRPRAQRSGRPAVTAGTGSPADREPEYRAADQAHQRHSRRREDRIGHDHGSARPLRPARRRRGNDRQRSRICRGAQRPRQAARAGYRRRHRRPGSVDSGLHEPPLQRDQVFARAGEEVAVLVEIDDDIARVSVRDRGPGIPSEFQGRIFGKFQQAESSSSRRHGGTGLGLAIARAIVERHAGQISFRTERGAGTTFVVELPCSALTASKKEE